MFFATSTNDWLAERIGDLTDEFTKFEYLKTAHSMHSPAGRGRGEHEHTYENLEFHRVKISVPGHNGGRPFLLNNAGSGGGGGCLDRRKKAPQVNSRVIRRAGRVSRGARPSGGAGGTAQMAAVGNGRIPNPDFGSLNLNPMS